MKKKFLVTKETTIEDLVRNKPEAVELLFAAGMHCIGCAMSQMETIEQGCFAHGMNKKEIEKLIEDINKIK
jgi:hybrid cluster-associated redox disulfide protein